MKKIKVIGILILLLFLVCGYLYVYKDHRNIATEKERFSMDVQTLFAVYQKNENNHTHASFQNGTYK